MLRNSPPISRSASLDLVLVSIIPSYLDLTRLCCALPLEQTARPFLRLHGHIHSFLSLIALVGSKATL